MRDIYSVISGRVKELADIANQKIDERDERIRELEGLLDKAVSHAALVRSTTDAALVERVRELEEENANLLLHVTDMRGWNSRASAHSEKVQAENKRLREAIEGAPCACYGAVGRREGSCGEIIIAVQDRNCWKRKALEGE